ncbi:MAG: beta-ketoacyl-[acyl-carrier-protein] synthase family protein [Bilifractor sp.]
MTERSVVVTGLAMMSAGGNDEKEFTDHARNGFCGIRRTDLFPTDKLRTDFFGQLSRDYVYEVHTLEEKSRTECIFRDLADQLLADAGITADDIREMGGKAAFSMATSVGVNDYITAHVNGTLRESLARSNIYTMPESLGIRGAVYVNTSACAAGTTAIGTAYSLIRSGEADLVIAGGIDPLTEFSSYGFHSLRNLSGRPCRPFDRNRDGITLGEGGALFVVEDRESARKRGAKIRAEILGYGLGNDAYHPTSPDPTGQGACRVMEQAIEQAGISEKMIDYVNAHGTGTVINDDMEVKALDLLGAECTVTSTKSQIGHCLAAAGAIEFAATILSMEKEEIYPVLNLTDPIPLGKDQEYVIGQTEHRKIRYAMSNSFAFAGNAASVVIGRGES